MTVPAGTRAAAFLGRAVSAASRITGRGEGSVIGGRVTLTLAPGALADLAAGRRIALVTGTNGKTTTTRLLTAALATAGPVITNEAGANLLAGMVGALSSDLFGPSEISTGAQSGISTGARAAASLEVDEGLLPAAVVALRPVVVIMLNLSRDQLDRIGEVRRHALAWRRALLGAPDTVVVANADDPLVTWAAIGVERVRWVQTGLRWRSDAASCPECANPIVWHDPTGPQWSCSACSLARPQPHVVVEAHRVVFDGIHLDLSLALPGQANRANAAMAAAAAGVLGVEPAVALGAMSAVSTVAGRYEVRSVDGVTVRLLLAKNPAGWSEVLGVVQAPPTPVVVAINARTADGRDPSWLWDVAFERLADRMVVATGERGRDLAVRLRYAGVDHRYVDGFDEAVRAAGADNIDLIANYTAFQQARRELHG